MIRAAAALALVACDARAPLDDCAGDLRGVWHVEGGGRWHAIGGRDQTWELFPMDEPRAGVIDLPRGAATLEGTITRRYEQGARICVVRAPALLRDCRGDRATLEVSPPAPPADYVTCLAPPAPPQVWSLRRSR